TTLRVHIETLEAKARFEAAPKEASYAASRSSSTALQVGAASSRSSPVSRSETKAPIHASSSPILTSATLACSTKMSTAGAARRRLGLFLYRQERRVLASWRRARSRLGG